MMHYPSVQNCSGERTSTTSRRCRPHPSPDRCSDVPQDRSPLLRQFRRATTTTPTMAVSHSPPVASGQGPCLMMELQPPLMHPAATITVGPPTQAGNHGRQRPTVEDRLPLLPPVVKMIFRQVRRGCYTRVRWTVVVKSGWLRYPEAVRWPRVLNGVWKELHRRRGGNGPMRGMYTSWASQGTRLALTRDNLYHLPNQADVTISP